MKTKHFKIGLNYFSFDVDFFSDPKIEFVSAKYGEIGELIIIKLLCKIYRHGYYLTWGEDECLLFSKKAGDSITRDLVDGVINECLKRDFFNLALFEKYSILTSNGIQKRYIESVSKRKGINIYKEYLLGNNVDIIQDNTNIILDNIDIIKNNVITDIKGGGNPNLTFKGQSKGKDKGKVKGEVKGILEDENEYVNEYEDVNKKEEKERESEREEKREKEKFDFEFLWKQYPNRDGKKQALVHFNSSVKTQEDYENIQIALKNYLNSGKVKGGYIKLGSTWFNNWQDWIEPSEEQLGIKPMPVTDKNAEALKTIKEREATKNGLC